MSQRRALAALALLACLAGCATSPRNEYAVGSAQSLPRHMELADVPFYPQEKYQCGPASLAMVLGSAGVTRSPQQLEDQVYLPTRQGSLQPEMLGASRRAGVVPYVLEAKPDALLQEVAAGNPVVVLQNLRFDAWPQWHYAVVVGYDLAGDHVVLRSGREKRLVVRVEDFERSWARAQRWAFVVVPTDRLPATARESDFVAAVATFERVSPANAARAYQTALDAWPNNLFARMALGNLYYHQGRRDDALAQYRQAAAAHPDAADAWNNLAQVLLEQGQIEDARAAASRAVAIGGPHLPTYESTMRSIDGAAAAPQ
ncbi:MAG TPA: PA2778 family cysteine peptidase [Steroidobacteraceae bacterium]|nr:PA2778 family cysteine peptidase [Steroidobacteraceae bacterium]